MDWCEQNRVHYIFGLSTNAVLAAGSPRPMTCASGVTGNLDVVRDYTETRYAAKSWLHFRRLARIEATRKGLDEQACRYQHIACGIAAWLYDGLYCARGQAENLIKRHKSQLASDRTSCRSPLANQMRLILHTAAYWLMLKVRGAIPCMQPLAGGEFSTIRLRLLQIAVRIKESTTRIKLAFAANCPDAPLFRGLILCADPAPNANGAAKCPGKTPA